jgi:hypothetical protein
LILKERRRVIQRPSGGPAADFVFRQNQTTMDAARGRSLHTLTLTLPLGAPLATERFDELNSDRRPGACWPASVAIPFFSSPRARIKEIKEWTAARFHSSKILS